MLRTSPHSMVGLRDCARHVKGPPPNARYVAIAAHSLIAVPQ
jgi:hypothetical protein